jgi:hypothetical protein
MDTTELKPTSCSFEFPTILTSASGLSQPITKVDHLIGLARPGLYASNARKPLSDEIAEIEQTLDALLALGVRKIISLSDSEYHSSLDTIIEDIWRAKLGVSKKAKVFVHIHNEDTFDNPRFRIGQGPTLRKMEQFLKEAKPIEDGLIAVYCRGGKGRTCSYLTSHVVSAHSLEPESAFERLMDLSKNSARRAIKDEMETNGGFLALQELYEKCVKS